MTIRDGRGKIHDLGPRRTLTTSSMKMIAWESTGSGGWNPEMGWMFEKRTRAPGRTAEQQREVERQHRITNIEDYRARERASQARYRARLKAAGLTRADRRRVV